MNLTSYVGNLGREFATLAEAGGDEARTLVERLTGSLESAIRMTLLGALAAASEESAATQGRSVNAWLVRAAASALQRPERDQRHEPRGSGKRSKQHITG